MGTVSILALFSILREFVEKISVSPNLYGHFVEKCSVFVALVFEGPLQSRPQDDVGDVALLMVLSTPSEFGKKTNALLYRHGDFAEKCSVFVALGFEGPLQSRPQDDVGDVALLMLLSTPSEFKGKTNVFLYRYVHLVEKCIVFSPS